MALILNIDTSSYNCSIALGDEDKIIAYRVANYHNHTQVLLPALSKLLNESGYTVKDLSAIAVNIGPGSYTGLRVGLATAKGICYSSGLPLIPINGLSALAYESIKQNKYRIGAYVVVHNNYRGGWYYAVYDESLNHLLPMDSTNKIETVFPQIRKSPIFRCDTMFNDRNNTPNEKNIIYLPAISPSALHLSPIALSILYTGTKYDISSAQPFYPNSLFSSQ